MLTHSLNTNHTILSSLSSILVTSLNGYTCENVQIIEKLSSINKNFKYIVHVMLVAKGGNGLDVGGLYFWNPDMDGSVSTKW
ncbi:MAG: dynein light chain Tctex-type family protein [Bacteriovorax sp.]|nr:dynein light chain Tctex-type family protein [Bacteriovorax sp.]